MSDLRAMIEAARADGPSAAATANVWTGVSTMVGEAAVASGAGGAAATGSAGAAKMLVLGTLLGGTVTVGVGVAMLFVGRAPAPAPPMSVAAPAPARGGRARGALDAGADAGARAESSGRRGQRQPRARAGSHGRRGGVTRPRTRSSSRRRVPLDWRGSRRARGRRTRRRRSPPAAPPDSDSLAREASSLAEARRALARRDALSALQIVRDLHALPDRQLVPEELAVEAQALRGLGLDDEASQVETHLRVRFPDSVLGR